MKKKSNSVSGPEARHPESENVSACKVFYTKLENLQKYMQSVYRENWINSSGQSIGHRGDEKWEIREHRASLQCECQAKEFGSKPGPSRELVIEERGSGKGHNQICA